MAKKAHPTLNPYQHKMIYAKAHSMGVRPAVIIKEFLHNGFVNMTEKERDYLQKHWENMSEEERKNPGK